MILRNTRRTLVASALTLAAAACGGAEDITPMPDPVPDDDPVVGVPAISISPHSGTAGSDVQVSASGFEAGERVGIGFGPPQSEYQIFARATADASGDVTTTVSVPDWAEAGRDYLFVVAPEGTGEEALSSTFTVEAAGPGDDTVEVTGLLTDEGVECQALRTEAGELYTLAGETGRFDTGDRVEVEGTIVEVSICQQGMTITVENISDAG
jgi:hypothetical protein